MAGESAPICSACETRLGDPEDEIAGKDVEADETDAHFVIQERKDGELRAQCTDTGRLAAVVAGTKKINPISGEVTGEVDREGEGGTGEPTQEQPQSNQPQPNRQPRQSAGSEVYDLPEDRDQEDVLMEVVSNDSYGLSTEQIKELKSWSKDYDGQMPPDAVQEVLSLMNGINKQTAKLVRERYELRLNRWIREQNREDQSPSIGAGNQRGVKQRSRQGGSSRPAPTPNNASTQDNQKEQEEPDENQEKTSRMEARQRRRSRAVDKAVDEFADQFAKNLASDAGSFFSDARDIARTLLKKKAEKDPDWFFEKMEQYDMELVDTVLEPSDQRKDELMGGGGSPSVDSEIDDALEDIGGPDPSPSPPDPDPPSKEETKSSPTGTQSPMTASPDEDPRTQNTNTPQPDVDDTGQDDGGEDVEEDQFEEIFG